MGRSNVKSALKMQFEDELGVLPPVGYFDPLGELNTNNVPRHHPLQLFFGASRIS